MKFSIGMFSLLAMGAACFAEFDPTGVAIIGKTNKSALSYQPGEEMVYTFTVDLKGQRADGLFLKWRRRGDDGKVANGKSSADKPLIIKTKLDKPGFVNIDVSLVDAKDKPVSQSFKPRWEKNLRKRKIQYFAGTAVKPETLTDCGEPKDFDAFWVKQRKRLAAVPFAGKVELKKVRSNNTGDVYAVKIPCAGPRPVTGYMTIPKNAKPKSLPITIGFFGYGCAIQGIPWIPHNALKFEMNAHGQELGQSPEYYKKFFASINTGKTSYGFDKELNKNPETAFFNQMTLRIIRALEYLKTRPEWNGKEITASGGSQGGMQTIWAAALDPDVTLARPDIPWCCDLAGHTKKDRACDGWRIEWTPALDYYDPVFLAKRIKKAKVEITRAGLGDYCCPPAGVCVLYKNIASPNKSIRWVQGSSHGFVPEKSEVIIWSTAKKK